jgi:hypothetical protein
MQAHIIYKALDAALNEGLAAAEVSFFSILGLVGCGRLISF